MPLYASRVCHLGRRFHVYPFKFVLISSLLLLAYFVFWKSSSTRSLVQSDSELQKVQTDILKLSKIYVNGLAKRLRSVNDGPAAYPYTAYDMKKALAVLIQSLYARVDDINIRLTELERQISHYNIMKKNEELHGKDSISMNDLVHGKQDACPFPDLEEWPKCQRKINWMKEMWKSDACYSEWGVDGTDCSIYMYLSEQEKWCPPFPWRVNKTVDEEQASDSERTLVQGDFKDLLSMMANKSHLAWVKLRIERMSQKWIDAGIGISNKYNLTSTRKKVLLHMGLLSEDNGWNIAKNAFSGGPLGELVQWSDLISAIYTLGHTITLTKTTKDLQEIYNPFLKSASSNCPLKVKPFDIVYTDIIGLRMLKNVAGNKFHLLQCNLRIIDSFGTEPEFNHPNYASTKSHKSSWGRWNLNTKQFNTMFPHTPDNTFLGFVVEEHANETNMQGINKENIALVYGKRDEFWKESLPYITAIHEVMEVHATVGQATTSLLHVPDFVVNHGVLPGFELHKLLRRSKVFIGLGFPYEGPAPLEAIANGAIFLNPVFPSPHNSLNTAFFKGKPTLRNVTSQHPYAEMYIGPPHVRSVDMGNLSQVKEILNEIKNSEEVGTFMPYEFTCEGMLERLHFYLQKQDFCTGTTKPVWPPESAMQVKISNGLDSCSSVCHKSGLICEPAYFPLLNKASKFKLLNITCSDFPAVDPHTEVDFPAFLHDRCFLQGDISLFSCAGRYTDMHRVCPCRDYLKGQVALCEKCVET